MHFVTRALALAGATAPLLTAAAPAPPSQVNTFTSQAIPGKFLVQLKPGVNINSIAAHHVQVANLHRRNTRGYRRDTNGIAETFSIGGFNAYAGSFDAATIQEISNLDEVLAVEPDFTNYITELVTQPGAPWGLGSISHRKPNSTDYIYDSSAGEGTFAYIVDTGIRLTHNEFEGRAEWGFNAVPGNNVTTDQQGHGTHVAATVAGKTYGVAKKATVVAVKVFEGSSGSTSQTIAGFNWAANDIITKSRQNVSVINLSLGGSGSTIWDSAISAAWEQGVLAVVASGNSGANVEGFSPGRAPDALTVGNIQQNNQRSASSNFGTLVDVFAPGTLVLSADYRSDNGSSIKSGTSMASPHVAGLVCYLRGLESPAGSSAADVTARVIELSTKDVVTDPKGSQNRLAFNGNSVGDSKRRRWSY